MPWYKFTPPGMGTPDVGDSSQYTLVGSNPPTCIGNQKLCAIQAMDNMTQPILTFALVCEIANALNLRTNSTNVLLCN